MRLWHVFRIGSLPAKYQRSWSGNQQHLPLLLRLYYFLYRECGAQPDCQILIQPPGLPCGSLSACLPCSTLPHRQDDRSLHPDLGSCSSHVDRGQGLQGCLCSALLSRLVRSWRKASRGWPSRLQLTMVFIGLACLHSDHLHVLYQEGTIISTSVLVCFGLRRSSNLPDYHLGNRAYRHRFSKVEDQ